MRAPRTMTRCRKLVATSHDGRYAYYLDSRDLYIYQFSLIGLVWVGWLCTVAVWLAAAAVLALEVQLSARVAVSRINMAKGTTLYFLMKVSLSAKYIKLNQVYHCNSLCENY